MSSKDYYSNMQREFVITDKNTNQTRVVFAIDRDHARAIGVRAFNTEAKNIKVKKL